MHIVCVCACTLCVYACRVCVCMYVVCVRCVRVCMYAVCVCALCVRVRCVGNVRFWSNFKESVIAERREDLHNYIQNMLAVPVLCRELIE